MQRRCNIMQTKRVYDSSQATQGLKAEAKIGKELHSEVVAQWRPCHRTSVSSSTGSGSGVSTHFDWQDGIQGNFSE